jgi:RHS repeat-associated protein
VSSCCWANPSAATGFTGKDKTTATSGPEVEPYNPYRFNSKRFDPATGGYDMGFRDYSPGLNRFLTRDMYSGALADMQLGTDPWNTNRYAFAGGNPITGIELDGHSAIEKDSDRFERHETPTIGSPGRTPVPNNVGQEINQSMGLPAGASQQQQAIMMAQLHINPTIAGLKLGAEEADRAGVDEAIELFADVSGTTDAAACGYEHTAKACGMTGMMLLPIGKLGKLARALVGLKRADEAAKAAAELPKANATVKDLLKLVPGNEREADKAAQAVGRTDQQLLESVFSPSDTQRMALYPDGRTLAQGNHRRYELLDRARDPFSSINWDTPIFIEGWKP